MKIGRNNSGLVVSLTEQEHALLFKVQFVKVLIDPNSKAEWIRLEKSDSSQDYRLSSVSNDKQHAVRLEMHGRGCPIQQTFATEHVATKSPMGGILYGAAPKMDREVMRQLKGEKRLSNPANMVGLDSLKEAVQIINNFMRQYGDQIQITVDGKEIKVRMTLEI
jgi:hypothetical protein